MLGLIALFGYALTKKLAWAYNPNGKFRKILGVVVIVFGLLLATGLIKQLEALILQFSDFNINLIELEESLKSNVV